jgi:hypothetical protein
VKDLGMFFLIIAATIVNMVQANKIWQLEDRVKKLEPAPMVEQVKHRHINLGTYDEKTHSFTLPDGRVVPAPITTQSLETLP